ncbi:helix-turn-helix transcriptional regulator [Myxococcus sp. RHST-1-4]|nr:helix-turn-helix transcriptional regulator [Myxococcus sp. RHSTA-1-4]
MALLDLLGRRWLLRIVWELRSGPLTFRALREACGDLSPTVLNTRLKELRDSGLVALDGAEGYALTPLGQELLERFLPLVDWAERWARRG